MQLKYTQRILNNSRPAVENENTDEVVDQAVIDAQPTDAPVDAVADDVVVEPIVTEGDIVDPDPETVEPGEDVVVDAPVGDVVENTDAPVDGIDPVEPPQVIPTTDNGEVTVDQVEAVVDGDPEAAAEAVVEADADAGVETTVAEVIEDAEQAAAEEPTEAAAEGETEAVADEPSDVVGVADITPEGEVETTDAPVSDAEFNAVEETTTQDEANATEEAESALEPVADDTAPAVEDCACEADGENVQPAVTEGDGVAELPAEEQVVEEAPGANVVDGAVVVEDAVEVQATDADAPVVDAVVEVPLAEEAPVVVPVETVGAVADEPVAADVLITADDGDIDVVDYVPEDQDTVEVLEEALDTYPQIVEVLEGSLDNGGISLEAMAILDIFMRRDGISKEPTLALESYNFTSRTQTRVAVESIGDDMKAWAAKAIELLKRSLAEFKKFMTARFTQVGSLERRAQALVSVDAGKPSAGNVEGDFLAALTTDGKIDGGFARDYHAFSRDVVGLLGVTGAVIGAAGDVHKAVRSSVLDKVINKESTDGADVQVGKLITDAYGKALSNSGTFKKEADGKYVAHLLGGQEFTVLVTGTHWVSEPRFSQSRNESNVTSAQSLSGKDIAEVSKSTLEIVAALKGSSTLADFEAVEGELLQDLERLAKLSANVQAGENTAVLNELRKYYTNTSTFLNGFVAGLNGATLRTANAALKYAEASAKATA